MTAQHARIVRENDDELGYWIEVNRDSMFAGLRQKLAAVALLFQALAAFPEVAKGWLTPRPQCPISPRRRT
jgi:hypothetical protein